LTEEVIPMQANGKQQPFFLGVFVSGMAFSYAFHLPGLMRVLRRPGINSALNVFGFVLLLPILFTAPWHHEHWFSGLPWIGDQPLGLGTNNPEAFGLLCSLFIFVTLVCEGRAINRLFASRILRALGIVSFSFYLVHFMVIMKLRYLGMEFGNLLFAASLVVTYLLSCAIYGTVERPFMRRASS
jgi:peptidoglycan/LPS O-acetylase OafA/YrhL